MRTWIVAGSLLIMMLSACAPVGSATLHDVVLIDEEGAQRLRYAYGTADTLDLDEATYTLGDLVARSEVNDPFAVQAARLLDEQPFLLDTATDTFQRPFDVVRVPLTTDLELRTREALESVHYFDGTRWFTLARNVEANLTRSITPVPTTTPLRGDASLTPAEADAIATGLSQDGAPRVVATLAQTDEDATEAFQPAVFEADDPGGLDEYLHSVVYVQTDLPVDDATYRDPGQRALFEIAASGRQGVAPDQDRFALVNDAAALSAFWSEVQANALTPPALPDARFGSETLVAVQLATRPSSGYGIDVQRVERRDGEVFIDLVLTEPAEGAITSTVITNPWVLIRVLGIDADVVWFRNPDDGRLFAVARASEAPF